MEHTTNIRAGERHPFQGGVEVSWRSRAGDVKLARAQCVDFSQQGARIICEQPIDVRTNVYLKAPSLGLLGNASVRYCRRAGLKHMIGLMFSSPLSQAETGRKRCLAESEASTENT